MNLDEVKEAIDYFIDRIHDQVLDFTDPDDMKNMWQLIYENLYRKSEQKLIDEKRARDEWLKSRNAHVWRYDNQEEEQ